MFPRCSLQNEPAGIEDFTADAVARNKGDF